LKIAIIRQAGDMGQLYGSVSTRDIADAATEAGFTLTRGQVKLDRALKTVGLHEVIVQLHPEVSVDVIVNIARTEEEAQIQAQTGSIQADSDEDDVEEEIVEDAAAEESTEEEATA